MEEQDYQISRDRLARAMAKFISDGRGDTMDFIHHIVAPIGTTLDMTKEMTDKGFVAERMQKAAQASMERAGLESMAGK